MKKFIIATILVLLPFVLSAWDLQEKIVENAPMLEPIVAWIPWVSMALLLLLVLVILVELIGMLVQAFYRLQPSTLAHIAVRNARSEDIPAIVELAQKTMGNRITENNTRLLYNHNTKCIKKIVDTRHDEIVGYFCLLPLTVNGEKAVMDRDLISDELQIGNFAKNFRRGCPVHIGSLAASSSRGRAATLEMAKTFLASLEISKAFTRPVTPDGVRLVRKFGFVPVNEHDPITKNVYVMKIREPF